MSKYDLLEGRNTDDLLEMMEYARRMPSIRKDFTYLIIEAVKRGTISAEDMPAFMPTLRDWGCFP